MDTDGLPGNWVWDGTFETLSTNCCIPMLPPYEAARWKISCGETELDDFASKNRESISCIWNGWALGLPGFEAPQE